MFDFAFWCCVMPQCWLFVSILAGCFGAAAFLCVECDSSFPLSRHGAVCWLSSGWSFRFWLVVSVLKPGLLWTECKSNVQNWHYIGVCCLNAGWLFRYRLVLQVWNMWSCVLSTKTVFDSMSWFGALRQCCMIVSILAGGFGSETCLVSWCGVLHQCWLAISILAGYFGSVTCSDVWWNR